MALCLPSVNPTTFISADVTPNFPEFQEVVHSEEKRKKNIGHKEAGETPGLQGRKLSQAYIGAEPELGSWATHSSVFTQI